VLDFISYNRFNTFIDRLVTVRTTVTSTSYVDNSPNDLFTSPTGTILQKRGNVFSYKYPGDSDFTTINYANNSIEKLCKKYEVLLSGGVNRNVTWIKTDNSPNKTWANRGVSVQECIICEIAPSAPCATPIVTYIIPTYPIPTSPLPNCCGDLGDSVTINTLRVTTLIVDSTTDCPPSTAGTYGQISVCENYLYIYDSAGWKRFELSNYY
jgi:hypothetical protein